MNIYYLEYKERSRPEWERYGTSVKIYSIDELISYYKKEFNNIAKFRLGISTSDSCFISWYIWKNSEDYPYELFVKYVKKVLK